MFAGLATGLMVSFSQKRLFIYGSLALLTAMRLATNVFVALLVIMMLLRNTHTTNT